MQFSNELVHLLNWGFPKTVVEASELLERAVAHWLDGLPKDLKQNIVGE